MAQNPAHARIAVYQTQPGTADALTERVRTELLPQIQREAGFRRYTALRTGPDTIVSITAWDTQEQAEQAAQRLTSWGRAVFGSSLVSAQNHIGELAFISEASAATPGYGRVGIFHLKPGVEMAELRRRAEAEMAPLLRQQPGFIRYVAWQTGPEHLISYTAFATQAEAEASAGALRGWTEANVTPAVAAVERHAGTVIWSVRKE